MNIGDIVIVREDAENWSQSFMQRRKFILGDQTGLDTLVVRVDSDSGRRLGLDYSLKPYNWPQSLMDEVFCAKNNLVFITKAESKDLVVLDKEFIENKTLRKFKLK